MLSTRTRSRELNLFPYQISTKFTESVPNVNIFLQFSAIIIIKNAKLINLVYVFINTTKPEVVVNLKLKSLINIHRKVYIESRERLTLSAWLIPFISINGI